MNAFAVALVLLAALVLYLAVRGRLGGVWAAVNPQAAAGSGSPPAGAGSHPHGSQPI